MFHRIPYRTLAYFFTFIFQSPQNDVSILLEHMTKLRDDLRQLEEIRENKVNDGMNDEMNDEMNDDVSRLQALPLSKGRRNYKPIKCLKDEENGIFSFFKNRIFQTPFRKTPFPLRPLFN